MNLHHLSIFHAIAETGSITAASERLHISQSALSRELRAFEHRMGLTLFERRARGMWLTLPGELLRDYAERLFALEAEAESAMREVASARRGRFAVGASNTIGTYVLPQLLSVFRRERPEVHVSLFVGNTEQVSQGVADMRFTLGFVEGPLHVKGLTATTFQNDEIVPVAGGDHPLANKPRIRIGDMAGHTLLMRERGSGTRELIADLLQSHGLAGDNVMEFSNTEALKQAVRYGGGIAWLPRISMRPELLQGSLFELPIPALRIRRPLRIIHRDSAYLTPLAEAFIERLRTVVDRDDRSAL